MRNKLVKNKLNKRNKMAVKYIIYRKIPNISPELITFQRPFLEGLYLGGTIFGGDYIRKEVYVRIEYKRSQEHKH